MPARSAPTPPESPDLSRLRFFPATASRWKDVERLFGDRGACGGCWCMYWRLPHREWEAGKGAGNRRKFRNLIESGARPGVVAYLGREPVGWCALAPREEYGYLARSRVLKPVDDRPVWSVSCFFVLRPYRRLGVATLLLKEAVAFAGRRGARIVEGYPRIASGAKEADAFLWNGVPSIYEKAGFREVARFSPKRPIMRITIGGKR